MELMEVLTHASANVNDWVPAVYTSYLIQNFPFISRNQLIRSKLSFLVAHVTPGSVRDRSRHCAVRSLPRPGTRATPRRRRFRQRPAGLHDKPVLHCERRRAETVRQPARPDPARPGRASLFRRSQRTRGNEEPR